MDERELIAKELDQVPDSLLGQVLDYIRSLKYKGVNEKFPDHLLSESSLGKDWLRPEEDEAWKDL